MNLSQEVSTEELQYWFNAPAKELKELFLQARQVADENLERHVSLFTPNKRFPAISITGAHCQLDCSHCGGHFLSHMHSITNPNDLLGFCLNHAANGGVGCLISGGCDEQGQVPLVPFFSALAEIKQTTQLFLNVHTGLFAAGAVQLLAETGIDCASVDVVGANSTLHRVYGLTQRTTKDYSVTLQALASTKISVAPHVCVGLHFGKLLGELAALQLIYKTVVPSVLVIIALLPTLGTRMAQVPPPSNFDIARVCALARLLFPRTNIALGCMRPRGSRRREMEELAIKAGVNRLVLPAQSTIEFLKKEKYTFDIKESCCVVPRQY